MKLSKFAAAALGASALALLSGSVKAANTVILAGAGSSALWKTVENGVVVNSVYTNHYSLKGGASIVDPSRTEVGNIWIAWKGSQGNYTIAYYVQVDSTVGDRAFFNSNSITITRGAPDNTGYPGSGDTLPPTEVFDAVAAATINTAFTDITPADALVATNRSIGLGYNATTNPIKSNYSGATASPVAFNLNRAFDLNQIGAAPIMVFINTSDTAAGGFGSISNAAGSVTGTEFRANIDRFTLSGFLSGQLGRTRDLISDPTLRPPTATAAKAVTTIVREPLSGTYNTMEYCVPESVEVSGYTGGAGQENNFPKTVTSVTGAGGVRRRAIGTGESVTNANATTNALGYAFWSFPNFSGKTNLRYLTVDGCDPLVDAYAGGSEGNLQSPGTITFRNIKNGGYPIWSVLRAVIDPVADTAGVGALLSALPAGDFVKFKDLEVFRSYHATPDVGFPDNGNTGNPAAGGDVGGAVFPINADVDNANDTGGSQLINLLQ